MNLLLALLLAAMPARIVSTTPSATEILFALGLGDRVVGDTIYCNYPPEARNLPKIGSYIQPDLEAIAALRPDLVVIQKNPIQLADKLARLRLNTIEITHDSVAEALESIQRIADATGVPERGKQLAGSLRGQLDEIRSRVQSLPRRKMVFIVSRTPGEMQGLIAVGKASYLSDLIGIAGGENIFADAIAPYPKITLEDLMARDPDVVVDMGEMAVTTGVTDAQKQAVVELWKNKLPAMRAVRQGRVFAVANDIYVQPGPRMAEAARSFARMLHPEAGF